MSADAWAEAIREHEAALPVGTRVRIVEAECDKGSRETVGKVGRIIRICRQDGPHVDPAIYPYVLDNDKGHSGSHCFEVWIPGEWVTWWAALGELILMPDPTGPERGEEVSDED